MVTKHFTERGHSFADMSVLPLQKISNSVDTPEAERLLQEAETLWIERLYTAGGKGLNVVVQDRITRLSGLPSTN